MVYTICIYDVPHDLSKGGTKRNMATELISINEAARRGIERVRKPEWSNPYDHIKIDIIDGRLGPWLHLWCPYNKECNGKDPVGILIMDPFVGSLDAVAVVPYNGPLPDSDEYKNEVDRFAGFAGFTGFAGFAKEKDTDHDPS